MLAKEAVIVRDALDPSISESAQRVRAALEEKGLETPMAGNGLSDEQKRLKIESAMREVMDTLGLDLSDDSLCDTPKRIAKMYVDEILAASITVSFQKLRKLKIKCV